MPLASAEEETRLPPWTDERFRGSAQSSVPGVAWRLLKTPSCTPRLGAGPFYQLPHSTPVQTPKSDDIQEIGRMMTQQTAIIMHHVTSLMSRQEEIFSSLLRGHPMDMQQTHIVNVPPAAKTFENGRASQMSANSKDEGELHHNTSIAFVRSHEPESKDDPQPSTHHKNTTHELHQAINKLKREAVEFTEETHELSCVQRTLQNVLKSKWYDLTMGVIIVVNCILIIVETDLSAECSRKGESDGCAPRWMFPVSLVLLIFYTLETVAVVDTMRWNVLRHTDRLFEATIVLLSYVDLVLLALGNSFPSVEYLRLVRITRLLRMTRLFTFFPELGYIMLGFVYAFRAMLWGFLVLMLILLFYAIVAVEMLSETNSKVPHDSEYCAEAFDSIWNATLLFFQVIPAGDSWGACMLPLLKMKPWLFGISGVLYVAVQVGFLNLIMSVIIDRVAEAREHNKKAKFHEKEKEIEKSRRKWIDFFNKIDTDGSGTLSLEEFLSGFDREDDFTLELKLLGIERSDLPTLLQLMDDDCNGTVSRDELLSMFDMIWNFDNKLYSVSMGMQLRTVHHHLEQQLHKMSHKLKHLERRVMNR